MSMSVKDLMQSENGAMVKAESGTPSSMCGLDWFKKLCQSMPKALRSQLVVENYKLVFREPKSKEKFCNFLKELNKQSECSTMLEL